MTSLRTVAETLCPVESIGLYSLIWRAEIDKGLKCVSTINSATS